MKTATTLRHVVSIHLVSLNPSQDDLFASAERHAPSLSGLDCDGSMNHDETCMRDEICSSSAASLRETKCIKRFGDSTRGVEAMVTQVTGVGPSDTSLCVYECKGLGKMEE